MVGQVTHTEQDPAVVALTATIIQQTLIQAAVRQAALFAVGAYGVLFEARVNYCMMQLANLTPEQQAFFARNFEQDENGNHHPVAGDKMNQLVNEMAFCSKPTAPAA